MESHPMSGRVIAVCCNPEPGLPKPVVEVVHLIELRLAETPVFQAGDEQVFLSWGLGTGVICAI